MANQFRYIIVGAGLAGSSAIEGIREQDRSGTLAMFGKEGHLPYNRPPLSKGLWTGKEKISEISVHDEGFYRRNNVHLFLESEVVEIDSKNKRVIDKSGTNFIFDKLLLATGGSPRALSFGGDAVRYFRTVEDYLALREDADRAKDYILIGGGFISCELAAALTGIGKEVTMIFPGEILLDKVLPVELATFMTEYYEEKGVRIIRQDIPTSIERLNAKTTVTTKAGKKITGDVAVAAIGLNLHLEMAKKAGLKIGNGVMTNEFLQTSASHIYAAGDIASFPSKTLKKTIRMEHWNNAQLQGKHAGRNMAGAEKRFDELPYFWSDLFDFGFEAVGEVDSGQQVVVDWHEKFREGVMYYLDDRVVRGILLWNVWESVEKARSILRSGREVAKPGDVKGIL